MKKIDIKGKAYVPVNERLLYFRDQEAYKDWTIRLEVKNKKRVADECLVRCRIYDELGMIRAEEWAYERVDSSFINKLSHVENCCTSAMGRALGQLGIGIDDAVASFEEVANNLNQQQDKPWLTSHEFNQAVASMNNEPTIEGRRKLVSSLVEARRMKKDYRRQLDELIPQRDIEL